MELPCVWITCSSKAKESQRVACIVKKIEKTAPEKQVNSMQFSCFVKEAIKTFSVSFLLVFHIISFGETPSLDLAL